ncbi:rod shape-determining protein MreD [Sphingobium subterraneum]|uniref:Rod shape-determining protein MreD n=1 Tax=Sphingobium subterraneum TaxID=627688 RepID=A0A841IZH4_9SPHN|nr:rod shape-determining protein MreD [Sphingobium subterraneum]MBB6124369.1 rod shape-determining protein MreD [Sphingobium subterraneum]
MTPTPQSRLGATPSRTRLMGTPVATVMFGSLIGALLPIVAQSPTLPPFGLLFLLAWRLLHPTLWPLWIGVPLGAFDDLATGAPLGSAVFLWTAVMIAIEMIDRRIFWRDYWNDWLIALVAVAFCLLGGALFARIAGSHAPFWLLLPQILWSALAYPLMVRLTATVDRWRIMA